jgi:hypothetical protein
MNEISFNQTPKHIHGISCSVVKCAYHDGVHFCTANHVTVGPSTAANSTQTVCATFKPKNFG